MYVGPVHRTLYDGTSGVPLVASIRTTLSVASVGSFPL